MAFPTCPDCRMPQSVGDDAVSYTCFSCYAEVQFYACPHCGFVQCIAKRWGRSFTCGSCDRKVDLPPRIDFTESIKAAKAEGVGYPYPKV